MEDLSANKGIPEPDTTYLKDIAGGDDEIARQIISIFIDDYPPIIEGLKQCAKKGDFEQIKFLTHKLVSQLPIIGITSAVADVKLIHKECSNMNDLPQRIDKLEAVIENNLETLKKWYSYAN